MKNLLLPVESKRRELDAKVLLSCFCAERGMSVVIGEQISLNVELENLPRGLYLDKSLSPHKIGKLVQRRALGNMIGCLDEEGIFYSNDEVYIAERSSGETMRTAEVCYTWGVHQHDLLKTRYPEYESRLVMTGGPRADLWRHELRGVYQESVDSLKEQYGNYILIPSNFVLYASGKDEEFIVRYAKKNGSIRNAQDESFYRRQYPFVKKLFEYFLDAIDRLSTVLPEHSIVVRPHPADDPEFWRSRVPVRSNVYVDANGPVTPWIIGAKAIIHNSCTTGLESFVIGTPVVAYQPEVSAEFDFDLPNNLSHRVGTLPELEELIVRLLKHGEKGRDVPDSTRQTLLRRHLALTPDRLASDLMARHLETVEYRRPRGTSEYRFMARDRTRKLKSFLCASSPGMLPKLLGNERYGSWLSAGRPVTRTANTTIQYEEICRLVESYQATLERFGKVRVRELADNVFLLQSETT